MSVSEKRMSFPWHGFKIGKRRFGVERSTVEVRGEKYLTRYILYVGGISLRLHKFWRGDELRSAPHDHPFWFVTIPFRSYYEWVFDPEVVGGRLTETDALRLSNRIIMLRQARAFRPHFRPDIYRHQVIGRCDHREKPFWTFCIAGFTGRTWGFWPDAYTFIPFYEYTI